MITRFSIDTECYADFKNCFAGCLASARRRVLACVLCLVFVVSGCSGRMFSGHTEDGERMGVHEFQESLLNEEIGRVKEQEFSIPSSAEAHYEFLRGELAAQDGDLDECRKHFEKAAEIETGAAPTLRTRLAELYVRDGQLENALAQLETVRANNEGDASGKNLSVNSDRLVVLQLRAGVLASLGRTAEAIDAYKELLQMLSNHQLEQEEIFVLLASLLAQEKRVGEAVGMLEQFVASQSKSVFGHYYLARLYEASGNVSQADIAYKKAVALGINSDTIILDYVRFLGGQKRYDEAFALCNKVLENAPEHLLARRMRAQLLLSQNKLEEAQKELEKLGELEEDATSTQFKIAIIKIERGDIDGAIVDLNLLLANSPDYSLARYYLATAYLRKEKFDEAAVELEKIAPSAQNYVQARLHLAYILQARKRTAEALRVLYEAGEHVKDNEQLIVFSAELLRDTGDLAGAIERMEKAGEINPKSDKYKFRLGVYYDELKQRDKSIQAMRSAINLNPQNADALNYLGYMLVENDNRLDEAIDLINRAVAIDPQNGYFVDSLGWAYYKLNKYQEALSYLERAVSLVPDDAVILEHLAWARFKVGNTDLALEVAKRAVVLAPKSDDKHVAERLQKLIQALQSGASEQEKRANAN